MKITQAYKLMLCEYPDVLNSKQVAELLGGVSIKTVYKLLQTGEIEHFVIGHRYFIPKINIFKYLRIVD